MVARLCGALIPIVTLFSVGCPSGTVTSESPDTGGEDAADVGAQDAAEDGRIEDTGTADTIERDSMAVDSGRDAGDTRVKDVDTTPRDVDGGCEETNGGVEICDDTDNDCDGRIDEVCPAGTTLVGGDNTDRINAVAAAPSGVYFGGTTSGPLDNQSVSGNFDGFVGRLADDGSIDWIRVFGADGSERIDALAVGPDGGVYAAGSGDRAFGGGDFQGQSDALLVKFDDTGSRKWVAFQGTSDIEFGRDVDVLSDGRVVVGYQSREPYGSGDSEGLAAVVTPQGDTEFTGSMGEDTRAVAAGPDGTFAIGGEVSGGFAHDNTDGRGGGDGFVAVIDSNGGRQWARLVGGAAFDTVHDIAFDGKSVYAVGATESSVDGQTPDGPDGFVVRIDGADTRAWFEPFGGAGEDAGRGVELRDGGELLVVGTVASEFVGEGVAGDSDVALLNLEADGTRVGHRLYGGPAADVARSIAVGPNAAVIGGRTEGDFEGEAHIGKTDGFVTRLR